MYKYQKAPARVTIKMEAGIEASLFVVVGRRLVSQKFWEQLLVCDQACSHAHTPLASTPVDPSAANAETELQQHRSVDETSVVVGGCTTEAEEISKIQNQPH
jgi:hypothetical protein